METGITLRKEDISALQTVAYEKLDVNSCVLQLHGITYNECREMETKLHKHSFCEFFYVTEGEFRTFANNKVCSYTKGQYGVLIPGLQHAHPRSSTKFFAIRFELERNQNILCENIPSDAMMFLSVLNRIPHTTMNDTDGALWQEWQHIVLRAEEEASLMELKLLLTAFIVRILSSYHRLEHMKTDKNAPEEHHSTLNEALNFIQANCTNQITAQDVADHIHISYSHLARLFAQGGLQSIHKQIVIARIDHAQHLLLTTNLSVADISEICCFKHVSHFSMVFSGIVGLSPTEFRNKKHTVSTLL